MTDTNTVHGGAVAAARKRLAQYVEGESYTAWRGEAPAGEPTLKRDLKLVLCTPQTDTDAREKVVEALRHYACSCEPGHCAMSDDDTDTSVDDVLCGRHAAEALAALKTGDA